MQYRVLFAVKILNKLPEQIKENSNETFKNIVTLSKVLNKRV